MRAPNKKLADRILGEPVEDWIARRLAEGRSLRRVPEDLVNATDGDVDVSHATVISWMKARAANDSQRSA